jgi:hypothetical protein
LIFVSFQLISPNNNSQIKSPSADRVKLLLMTLKDVKKFNLNDEMKGTIVDTLLSCLKATFVEKITSEVDDNLNVELEKQLFDTLKPFKSNFQEGCVGILRKALLEKPPTAGKLLYTFKIYQAAFEGKADQSLVKNYIKFQEEFSSKAIALNSHDKVQVLTQIIETNNAVLKDRKYQLDNTTIDEILCLLVDPRMKPSSDDIESFCKLYTAIGETLFVVANVRQNYFKSRISQYLSIYKLFMDAVYFFKNDQTGDLTPMEISLLLKLTLQLEK